MASAGDSAGGIPIRGIRMKFAVLAGLLEAGEVSNRDIVETIFNLLVGGQFDLEMNFIIQETESIICMVELLDKCDSTCQAEVWSMFTAVLKKSLRNLQACTEIGFIQLVLQCIDRADTMIADLMVDMLGVLASYSITVKELKLFFSKLKGEQGQWPPHAIKLLSVLKCMAQRIGPDSFFSFPGKSAAAIALPPIAKWPYQNGFTFHTWLRLDPINNINVDKDKPYLYCFRTSKGLGYSAHFVGGCLIVTSLKSKAKGFQHCVKYDFKPQKWYMVTIVHIYNRWKNSEISCYVNGELASYGEITWFVNTSDQLQTPKYPQTLKDETKLDLMFAEHHKMLLYDGKLSASIAFTYNPRATDAQLCLESSPKDNASIFVHSPHALMLQDVKAMVTHSVQSAIHSIGGVQVLFPLFAQLDFLQHSGDELDTSVCYTLLSFVMELLKGSVAMQEQVLACKGFLVIGYALEKSSKVHVTRPVLDIVLAFARYLSNLPTGVLLLKQLCDHILFNPTIWIHAPAKVQLLLYTYLATEFISTVNIYNAIRRVGTVLQIMHTLKYFYWVVNPLNRSGITPKGLDGPRPNQKEIHSLRAFLLLFVKQLIMKDHDVKEDELQSILNYLLTMHEDDNLMDVLQLLVALMSEHPVSMVQAFDQRNGIRVIFKLLASKNEGIRVQALKVLGYFLKYLSPKTKSEVMLAHGLFSLLTERLMLHSNQFTVTTYNVLFEILTEQICTQVIHKQHPDPDSTVKIQNPQILKVIAALLKNASPGAESMEVRRIFLSDMIKLFNNSRENRRSLLQCSVWQEWMLSLCFINPKNSEEQKITEMVYAIFRILLYHSIKYEWGGWRVWVDTLSITHSKVTFEQHKENLAHMFLEYQRMGSEEGSESRIRTVSGASHDSQFLASTNGELNADETAPSTVIELRVEEKVTDQPGDNEENRAQIPVTVSNILARDEEERQTDTIATSPETKKGDKGEQDTTKEPGKDNEVQNMEADMDGEHERVERVEADITMTKGRVNEKERADLSVTDDVDNTQTATNKDARVETEVVKISDEDDGKTSTAETVLNVQVEDKEKRPGDSSPEAVKEAKVEESSEASANQETSKTGSSITDEDSTDVSSVSNLVKVSDDSTEESSYVSATAGETDDNGAEKEDDGKEKEKKLETEKDEKPLQNEKVEETKAEPAPMVEVDLNQSTSIDETKLHKETTAGHGAVEAEQTPEVLPPDLSKVSAAEVSPCAESISQDPGTNQDTPKAAGTETSRLELKDTSTVSFAIFITEEHDTSANQAAASSPSGQGNEGSSSARSTMFRIPEFKWSHVHQRLLTDLMFSIETDVQMWRSHSTKTVMDFVNSSENVVFVHNTVHLVSQVVDNLIMACGGILPLLSAATSSTHELENIEPSQGLSVEASLMFLQRLINLVDVLIFASSLNFTEIEAEKNMSSGGILRQCLRLVCAMAVRNCLECQQHTLGKSGAESSRGQQNLLGAAKFIPAQSPVDIVTGGMSPIRDLDRLLQDMDISRLRAVVFRDIEDSKQAQFLALAVVYFISVLMVSKYRDILEPDNDKRHPQRSQSVRSTESVQSDLENGLSPHRRYSSIEDGKTSVITEAQTGPDAVSEALYTLSSEVRRGQDVTDINNKGKNVNVKDILRSLVSAPSDDIIVDPSLIPPGFLSAVGDASRDQSVQFHSFDRSVVVAPKRMGGAPSPGMSTVSAAASVPSATAASSGGTPVNSVSVVSAGETVESTESAPGGTSTSSNLPSVPALSPVTQSSAPNMSISERLEHALEKAAPLLREIFVDFAPFLSRTLLGSHGQELLIEGTSLVCMKSSSSVVELVMLLCSQVCHSSISSQVILFFPLHLFTHIRAKLLTRLVLFCLQSQCAQYAAEKRDEEKMCDHLIRAAKYRDHVTSTQLIQKIVNILTDKHGAWGCSAFSRPREFWRLDYWEDDLRRRRRFIRNLFGSTHSEATLKAAAEHGPVNLSTSAQLVAPAVVVKGTLSITAQELYFEVDEEDPSFKNIDPKILAYTEGLHGKWQFTEIRAVFSRRYLLQNTALEVFLANRTAVMFNFPDAATVKKVVHCLPRVGVGTNFGLPQTRRISLASPKQLYKASNMTQRWQRREISNFEYLMFLNTISGRTYNDLNQYPVFPWVITNYDSEDLDLTLPSNYRDLSKPIGALNPKRAAFFSERFESWEDEQVPKFHYGTHYSTSSFTQMWLLRIEPFTTFFLNFQGGKFDHADRTFSSVSRAWRNCQRDTSDVKELIPEFYYLPEMFVNSNNYNLGVMDDGTVVSDVELPPWAKSPEEFVRINRLALESEFVSCQLHQWIDLIFGYKQQGPEAIRALNVFYYLTYEGAVNLSSISDPMLREAVESQIRSFGQTPCQLLIEPHPPRSSAMQVTPLMFTEQMQQDVIMVLKFPSNSPVTHVAANTQSGLTNPAVITVTANRLFAVNKWHGLTGHQSSSVQDQQYQLPVEIDPLIANNVGIHRRQISDLLDQSIQVNAQCFVITADNRFILLCGFWDKSFRIYSTDTGKLTQIVFGHLDVVTCLARSESYIGGDCYVLSGSRDATLLLWYWNGKHSSIGENPGTEFVTPRAILTGHDCEVTCASVCAELGLVISGCREGPCLVHSMNGDLLRTLEGPDGCVRPRLVLSSTEGHCVIYYDKGHFCVFSINGKLLGHMEVEDIKAMLLSKDGQYLLCGGDAGVLSVLQIHDLKQLFAYPGCDAGIRSMAMSHDQRCIITGMASGSIVLFYNDFNRWHHEYQTRY
uniref:LPS responsive beige-like anchor protein n=1 Tax=Sinocyclocheilus grahami TaxID=75366 RepID=A0A672PEA1_SINGR